MCSFLGTTIGSSAFNERMATASLTKQLRHTLAVLMEEARDQRRSHHSSELLDKLGVRSIVGVDGSLASLWHGLAEFFPGCFTTASLKLHLATDLVTGTAEWFDLTAGSIHDSQRFPELEKGKLFIVDLGYWSSGLFREITAAQGFFLSRVKANCSVTITEVVSGGFGKAVIGSKLRELEIRRQRGQAVELLGEIRSKKKTLQVRVLGFWHKEERCYRWYITNLDAPKRVIAKLYRLRWQIEISFKSMKSCFNFDRSPTLSPNATVSLALVAICQYVMSTILRRESSRVVRVGQKKKIQTS